MKLFFIPFLFVLNQSMAQSCDTTRLIIDKCKIRGAGSLSGTIVKDQEVDPGGTPANFGDIRIRNGRGDCFYYIDGVKVYGTLTDSIANSLGIKDVQIITGGIQGDYGKLNGGIIRIGKTTLPARKFIVSDKEQMMANE